MSIALERFEAAKLIFMKSHADGTGNKLLIKIADIVNDLGSNFTNYNGSQLSEIQFKLAGYKFYLSDYVADLKQKSKAIELEIKAYEADRWDEISEDIKERDGKVRNKEQVKNVITIEINNMSNQQLLYDNLHYRYTLKLNALDDILTAVVQRIAEKKREFELAKINR